MTKGPRHKDLQGHPEAISALNEMTSSNDRTCAIVGLAFLENMLVLAIMSRLRDLDEMEQKKLFDEPLSLLSGFSRRVEIARALNLFNDKIKSDLERLNKIRNKFAHYLEVSDFNHQQVRILGRRSDLRERLRAGIGQEDDATGKVHGNDPPSCGSIREDEGRAASAIRCAGKDSGLLCRLSRAFSQHNSTRSAPA